MSFGKVTKVNAKANGVYKHHSRGATTSILVRGTFGGASVSFVIGHEDSEDGSTFMVTTDGGPFTAEVSNNVTWAGIIGVKVEDASGTTDLIITFNENTEDSQILRDKLLAKRGY